MFYKSIRFKITVLYMAILALTLTSFSVILYHNVMAGLYSNMDTLLKSKAGGIAKAIDTYWGASALETIDSAVKPEVLKKRRNTNFANVAQRWVKEESADPRLLDIIVQVFDTDGAIITSSKNTHGLADISRKNFITVLQGTSRFDTIISDVRTSNMTLRIFTTPVFENEKVAYIVQVASPLTSIEAALNNLKVALFLLFPVTILVTGVMGSFLAKAAMHPVDNMIQTIHQITAENMKLRIASPGTKDEVQKLAETFNDMLERLERAFTAQQQLFADLSHELKTPLTILRGEFEVGLKRARSAKEYEVILNSALEEISRMTKLADSLLLLAKFDSKEVQPEKKLIDITRLVQDAINHIRVLSEMKRIRLVLSAEEKILLNGDENQLKTAFLNLLDNAVKYTPESGDIDVTVEEEMSQARITVRDSGAGIPKEELKHIFDRFYRVEKSRNSSGFGLGLSIAKSIIEAHNGTIEVKSHIPQGTAFIITIPAA